MGSRLHRTFRFWVHAWHDYANLHEPPADWLLDGNIYRTEDQGRAEAGAIANTAYSLAGKYSFAAQSVTLAYQKINGNTPFDFVGGDSIYLANSIKYADFNGPGEGFWQARYDLNLATFGSPGLKFMTRYVTGRGIDGTHAPQGGAYNPLDVDSGEYQPQQGHGGRHWERDIDLRMRAFVVTVGENGFDVTIRIASLPDSTMIARQLGASAAHHGGFAGLPETCRHTAIATGFAPASMLETATCKAASDCN